MALNIFEQNGVKEVCDVQFIALSADSRLGVEAGDLVLYLDTLKVSTVETAAENVEARGGKGNPALVSWDFNKDITITLQDALFSAASLAVMTSALGLEANTTAGQSVTVYKIEDRLVTGTEASADELDLKYAPKANTKVRYINMTKGTRGQIEAADVTGKKLSLENFEPAVDEGDTLKISYDVEVDGTTNSAYQITLDSAHFGGTYKIVGDTLKRNRDGKDEPFQMIVERAKLSSNVSFSFEAEGDPSVFDMEMKVLRDDRGDMIRFIAHDVA